jgi:hypothetical protein
VADNIVQSGQPSRRAQVSQWRGDRAKWAWRDAKGFERKWRLLIAVVGLSALQTIFYQSIKRTLPGSFVLVQLGSMLVAVVVVLGAFLGYRYVHGLTDLAYERLLEVLDGDPGKYKMLVHPEDTAKPLLVTWETTNEANWLVKTGEPTGWLKFITPRAIEVREADLPSRVSLGRWRGHLLIKRFAPNGFGVDEVNTSARFVSAEVHTAQAPSRSPGKRPV